MKTKLLTGTVYILLSIAQFGYSNPAYSVLTPGHSFNGKFKIKPWLKYLNESIDGTFSYASGGHTDGSWNATTDMASVNTYNIDSDALVYAISGVSGATTYSIVSQSGTVSNWFNFNAYCSFQLAQGSLLLIKVTVSNGGVSKDYYVQFQGI